MLSSLINSVFNKKEKMIYNLGKYLDFTKVDDDEYLSSMKLKVVKYKDYKILKYVKESLNDENVNSLGLFRSVILKNNKLVSFAPPKCNIKEEYVDKETNVFEEFVEGTMVNLFYDGDEWVIATRSNISGSNNFFKGSKSFKTMFLEASVYYEKFSFDLFNKEYVYSFVLQHKENRMVLEVEDPKLYIVEIYKCNEKTVERISLEEECNVMNMVDIPDKYEVSTLEEAVSKYTDESTNHIIQGVLVKDGLKRYRLRNPNYEEVRKLRGNQPKIQYQYYSLRKEGKLNNYLRYYPEHRELFNKLRDELYGFTNELYYNYVSCFIKKEKGLKSYNGKYKQHMYKLQKHYIEELSVNKKRMTLREVINYVSNLEPAELMYSINFDYHERKEEGSEVVME
jgi:hypothetical protein